MSVRVFTNLGRPFGCWFAMALLFVLAAVSTGLVLGRSFTADGAAQRTTKVTTMSAVLQDGDWLSEKAWQQRREKRLRSNTFGDNPLLNGFGVPKPNGKQSLIPRFGSYRTLCVRLCDGYYFPISAAASPNRFAADERACQSRCDGDVRLFYYSNAGGSAETMRDRNGRAYSDLKTAFLYRTTYDKSCQCRPAPWTREARARHAMYATEGWKKRVQNLAKAKRRRDSQERLAALEAYYERHGIPFDGTGKASIPSTLFGFEAVPGGGRVPETFSQNRMGLGSSTARSSRGGRTKWRSKAFSSSD
jgi:hypothetical protein